MSELYAKSKAFLDSIAGLTEAQWNYKPAPGRWSIAECAEPVALAEDTLFQTITGKVPKRPAKPLHDAAENRKLDEKVLREGVFLAAKAQAPGYPNN